MTFAVDALPARLRQLARLLATLVIIAFLIALAIISVRYMQVQSFQKAAALRVPMSYVYAVVPLCAGVMAWYALVDAVELMLTGDTHEPREEML